MNDDEILSEARKRAAEAADADRANRDEAKIDLRFAIGEQWDDDDRAARTAAGKPTLTVNALPQFIRQVTAQIRQMNPAIRVSPDDDEASEDVAEIIENLVRGIQYRSDASSVYEAAAESAAACGIGHFRIRADYAPGASFDQEILIERVPNPFSVFWDPAAKEPTRKDAQFCFVVDEMPREAFEESYPDASTAGVLTSEHKDTDAFVWQTSDTVTVAEYFWIKHVDEKMGQLPNGVIVKGDELALAKQLAKETGQVIRERTYRRPVVCWAKITADAVLEGPVELPGRFIPVVSVTGEEWHLGEAMYRSSVIRFARDPQRLYNYARSTFAEIVTLQPKAPWLLTPDQIKGAESYWQSAHNTNLPYLLFNPDPKNPGPPQRVPPPVAPSGIRDEMMFSAEDMKRTIGIYDAGLGARSNETSGVAIAQRKNEGQMATSVYSDNLVKAIAHAGDIIVEMIPAIYDTRRKVKTMTEDGTEKAITINDSVYSSEGEQPVNDVTIGRYAVRVSVGPSYDTKRAEASAAMIDFIRAFPAAAAVTADLVAKSQDWPDNDVFAARLRKVLPPGVIDVKDLPEDQQAAAMQDQMQAQQMQQAQAQIEMAKAQAEIRKMTADAAESEADAKKAAAEAAQKQFELMIQSGQMQAAIQQIVAQTLQAYLSPQPVMMAPQNPSGGLPQ